MSEDKILDELIEEALEGAPKIEGYTMKMLEELTEDDYVGIPSLDEAVRNLPRGEKLPPGRYRHGTNIWILE